MAKIEMYTGEWCGYCVRAKQLLRAHGVDNIEEIDIGSDRTEIFERTGRMTIPQIFIDGEHVGGYDDLVAWVRDGRLEKALSEQE